MAGEFVWTGFDYLGEPTPYYAARSSYAGIVDLAGFPRRTVSTCTSPVGGLNCRWRTCCLHWTWPERVGQVTPVHVFTSGDEAELFVNGRSQGRRRKGSHEYRLRRDEVVYEPGEVQVVAYRQGKAWATATTKTAGAAARLALAPDSAEIRADGSDLSFVTLRVADAAGQTVPRADPLVRFSIDGPGEIVATDNGDATRFEPFPSHARHAFNGHALVIVRGRRDGAGAITVRAQADGLQAAEVVVRSVRR